MWKEIAIYTNELLKIFNHWYCKEIVNQSRHQPSTNSLEQCRWDEWQPQCVVCVWMCQLSIHVSPVQCEKEMKVRRPREERKEMERVRELHGLRGPATLITASYTFSKDCFLNFLKAFSFSKCFHPISFYPHYQKQQSLLLYSFSRELGRCD